MTAPPVASPEPRQIVLGAAIGFDRRPMQVFVESLRACGYRGAAAMLVGDIDSATRAWLTSHDVEAVTVRVRRWLHGPAHAARFRHFGDLLSRGAYDHALISDVRDVVFQADPFAGAPDAACHFFLESAEWRIGAEPYNARWAKRYLGAKVAADIADARISCCGVTLGSGDAMRDYLARMTRYLRSVPLWRRGEVGADTAFHNYILHVTREVPAVAIENNLHVATMGLEPAGFYAIEPDGVILTTGGARPAICHQYDRIPAIRAGVETRYGSA